MKLTDVIDGTVRDGWILQVVKGVLCEQQPNFSEKQKGGTGDLLGTRTLQGQQCTGKAYLRAPYKAKTT